MMGSPDRTGSPYEPRRLPVPKVPLAKRSPSASPYDASGRPSTEDAYRRRKKEAPGA